MLLKCFLCKWISETLPVRNVMFLKLETILSIHQNLSSDHDILNSQSSSALSLFSLYVKGK